MRLQIVVPGFGPPELETKKRIFVENLHLLHQTCPRIYLYGLEVHVYLYDDDPDNSIAEFLESCAPKHMHVHKGKGIVGQFIAQHAPLCRTDDALLFLLDDVELQPSFHLGHALALQRSLSLDILSPTLTDDSPTHYPYMRVGFHPARGVRLPFACEFFCYLMTGHAFQRWAAHLDPENPWMWGMDLLLTVSFGLRVGMPTFMNAKHHFQGLCYQTRPEIDPFAAYYAYLKKYNMSRDELSKMPALLGLYTSELDYNHAGQGVGADLVLKDAAQ